MGHKVETGPERLRHHVPRPHPNKMITDQIRSTVYLIDPTAEACRRHADLVSGEFPEPISEEVASVLEEVA
jgi:hypothetical protein